MAWCIGWIVSGIGLAATSLVFVERYVPKLGTVGNVMNAEVVGIPYPYILLAAACLMIHGFSGLIKEYDKRNST
jgi:hypothetical protein